MEEDSCSAVLKRRFRRISILTAVSLLLLYTSAALLSLSKRTETTSFSIAVPVEKSDELTRFLIDQKIVFFSSDQVVLQLDHYNPEQISIEELEDRFVQGDDRRTPFLENLPKLFDFTENGRTLRMFFPEKPLPAAIIGLWNAGHQDAVMRVYGHNEQSVYPRLFYRIWGMVCLLLSLVIQRKTGRKIFFLPVLFLAVLISGSGTVLWAAIFIGNFFLFLWRKWTPQREYAIISGKNIVTHRERTFIMLQMTAAVAVAVVPALVISGERLAVVSTAAMAALGIGWGYGSLLKDRLRPPRRHLVFRPLLGAEYRLPMRKAVPSFFLGSAAVIVPVCGLVFSMMTFSHSPFERNEPPISSLSYTDIYKRASDQPRGTLNALGFLEEKIFQYCYRYRKTEHLPEPGSEIAVINYFYENGTVRQEKIVKEIFTEDGFKSIMKKLEKDPLSVYFLSPLESEICSENPAGYGSWIFLSVFYFVLLIPFFRIPAQKIRFINIKTKGKV